MASHLHPSAQGNSERQPPTYYKLPSVDLRHTFKDFDLPINLHNFETRARSSLSQSFVLDYGAEEAWCAFDLSGEVLGELINTPRPPQIASRWIHLWYPHIKPDRVKALAQRYQFSPRLAGLIRAEPLAPKAVNETQDPHHHHHFHWPTSPKSGRPSIDHERTLELAEAKFTQTAPSHDLLQDLSYYDIVNSIWHWSSVDLGKRYLCLGYNSLHKVTLDGPEQARYGLPNGERIWNWLILCDDKTVISITEGSLVPHDGDAKDTRHNLLNVFRQLSKATDRTNKNPLSIVPVRYSFGYEAESPSDTAGLLFYYIFDDWYSTWTLLTKNEHQYGFALNKLRESMMNEAKLSHVDQLFRIGRQLATLKRMYQSYELLIDKVLDKDFVLRVTSNSEDDVADVTKRPTGTNELLGVHFSPDAMVRFERLRDRIRLYVLSEIQECIDTKDSLLMMNFNLITIKESDAVERLTRITILLAKVTILFLPVSLVTGYFSVQIPNLGLTVSGYWISFSVTLALSFIALFAFGKISGTAEGNMVYKPINRVMVDLVKKSLGRKKEA